MLSAIPFFAFVNDPLSFYSWGPLIQSSDGGITWDTIIPPTNYGVTVDNRMKPYVFGNKDSIVYAENIVADNMEIIFSTNNGKDWSTHPLDKLNKTYTMGMTSYAHCNDLVRTFIAPGNPGEDDDYVIVHTSNFGVTWDTLHRHFEVGAWIAISNCNQYICDALGTQASPPKMGIWGSHDRGKNWSYIAAQDFTEIDDDDFHNLSVVGNGAVIYAGGLQDASHRDDLWKTINGGNGSLSFTPPGSQLIIQHDLSSGISDTLSLAVCDTGYARIYFKNMPCMIYANFLSITIDGLAAPEYSSSLKHHLLCDDISDTITIPIFPLSTTSSRDLTVHAHFINDEYYNFDTSFIFHLNIIPGPNTAIYQKTSSISGAAGDTVDIPLYINSAVPILKKAGIDSVDLAYGLYSDLITPISFIPSAKGITADHFVASLNSSSVSLHFPSDFSFTGETEIGKLRVVVYLTDTSKSDITLSGAVHAAGCQSIQSNNSTIHFTFTEQCGDSSLAAFMKYGSIDLIKNIIPNPARNSVTIELQNTNSDIRYELFDALGIAWKSGITTNTFHLDTSDLPSGNYYLRVKNSIGIPATKKLIISK